jgi:hypothetical protein
VLARLIAAQADLRNPVERDDRGRRSEPVRGGVQGHAPYCSSGRIPGSRCLACTPSALQSSVMFRARHSIVCNCRSSDLVRIVRACRRYRGSTRRGLLKYSCCSPRRGFFSPLPGWRG